MGCVVITENAQVFDVNGVIIKGLYSAGEVTGGIHGSNRLGGNALADITVFGKIAGESAALMK
jgi:succinate dehydrogenase/fumarate reductase flavoprotein subunit